MNELSTDSLEKRIERLERQNHLMKRFNYIVIGVITVALLMGQSQCNRSPVGTKLIEAERVLLRDANGSAELTGTGLTLKDGDGNTVVALNGIRAKVGSVPYEKAELRLVGSNGNINLSVGAGSGNSKISLTPYIEVSSKDEVAASQISPGSMIVFDAAKIARAELGVDGNGASLTLTDKNHNTRAVLGSTSLVTTRTGAKTITLEESLTFFNKDGNVSWQMPR